MTKLTLVINYSIAHNINYS